MIYYSERDKELWTIAIESKCNWSEVKFKLQDTKIKLQSRFKEIFIKAFQEVNRLIGLPKYKDTIRNLTIETIEKIVNYSKLNRNYRTVDLYALLIEILGILVHKEFQYPFKPDKIYYLCRYFKYDDIMEQIESNFKEQLDDDDEEDNKVIKYEGQYQSKLEDISIPLQYEKQITHKTISSQEFLELFRTIVEKRNIPYLEAKAIECTLMRNIFTKK